MSKILVMYFSKYGATKKYAEWIGSELNGEILCIKDVNKRNLGNYDAIILGSGLYAGKIQGINILLDNYQILKDKILVIYTCGLADYSKIKNIDAIRKRLEKEIPENIIKTIKVYYLRGGIDYRKLNLKHKIMMALLKKIVIKRRLHKANEEDKEFIETYGQTMDFTDKNSINEIIEYCKSNKRIERVPSNCYYKNNIK